MIRLVSALCGLISFAFAGIATASGDPDVPKPDPPGHWRVITQDDATTTSKCVGNPNTPICALDTLSACAVRGDKTLCELAYRTEKSTDGTTRVKSGEYIKYRIISAERVKAKDVPAPGSVEFYRYGKWKAGDIEIIAAFRPCTGKKCDRWRAARTMMFFERAGDGLWDQTAAIGLDDRDSPTR